MSLQCGVQGSWSIPAGPMITYKLACKKDHAFDAWFRDSGACEDQLADGRVVCPICGTRDVRKAPMAPRVAKAREHDAKPSAPASEGKSTVVSGEFINALRELRKRVEENCDYVGERFAEEARKIHYGEVERRDIYGEAGPDEARSLKDEGVEVHSVPWVPRHDS